MSEKTPEDEPYRKNYEEAHGIVYSETRANELLNDSCHLRFCLAHEEELIERGVSAGIFESGTDFYNFTLAHLQGLRQGRMKVTDRRGTRYVPRTDQTYFQEALQEIRKSLTVEERAVKYGMARHVLRADSTIRSVSRYQLEQLVAYTNE